jgi:hypothetical protein
MVGLPVLWAPSYLNNLCCLNRLEMAMVLCDEGTGMFFRQCCCEGVTDSQSMSRTRVSHFPPGYALQKIVTLNINNRHDGLNLPMCLLCHLRAIRPKKIVIDLAEIDTVNYNSISIVSQNPRNNFVPRLTLYQSNCSAGVRDVGRMGCH